MKDHDIQHKGANSQSLSGEQLRKRKENLQLELEEARRHVGTWTAKMASVQRSIEVTQHELQLLLEREAAKEEAEELIWAMDINDLEQFRSLLHSHKKNKVTYTNLDNKLPQPGTCSFRKRPTAVERQWEREMQLCQEGGCGT